MSEHDWVDLGEVEELRRKPLQQIMAGRKKLALSYKDGEFSAISGVCNHSGGPLGKGELQGDFIVCPWHQWRVDCRSGAGEPGYEDDRVPVFTLEIRDGRLMVDLASATPRNRVRHKMKR